jgi:hypothetical protein
LAARDLKSSSSPVQKPWTFERVITLMPPGQELYEYAYDENNIDSDGGHLGYGLLDPKAYPLDPKIPADAKTNKP